jgi:hypothetical protein
MAINSFKSAGLANTRTLFVPNADFSNTATGTYTDSGVDYKYVTFTSSGTLTVTTEGYADVLVVGGGGGCNSRSSAHGCGGSGNALFHQVFLEATSHTITVGAGGAGTAAFAAGNGVASRIGAVVIAAGGQGGYSFDSAFAGNVPATNEGAGGNARGFCINLSGTARGAGSGGQIYGSNVFDGLSNSITGSAVTYGTSLSTGSGAANKGDGAGATAANGGSGVVIVRVRTN